MTPLLQLMSMLLPEPGTWPCFSRRVVRIKHVMTRALGSKYGDRMKRGPWTRSVKSRIPGDLVRNSHSRATSRSSIASLLEAGCPQRVTVKWVEGDSQWIWLRGAERECLRSQAPGLWSRGLLNYPPTLFSRSLKERRTKVRSSRSIFAAVSPAAGLSETHSQVPAVFEAPRINHLFLRLPGSRGGGELARGEGAACAGGHRRALASGSAAESGSSRRWAEPQPLAASPLRDRGEHVSAFGEFKRGCSPAR